MALERKTILPQRDGGKDLASVAQPVSPLDFGNADPESVKAFEKFVKASAEAATKGGKRLVVVEKEREKRARDKGLDVDELGRIEFDEGRFEYALFSDIKDRDAMKAAVKRVLKSAHDAGIKTVVAAGFSAKPAVEILLQSWEEVYGRETVPRLISIGDSVLNKEGGYISKPEEIAAFVQRYSKLPELVKEPVLLFDEYSHTGRRLWNLDKIFTEGLKADPDKIWVGSLVYNYDYLRRSNFREGRTIFGTWVSHHNDEMHPQLPWIQMRSWLITKHLGLPEPKTPYAMTGNESVEQVQKTLKQNALELRMMAREVGEEFRKSGRLD